MNGNEFLQAAAVIKGRWDAVTNAVPDSDEDRAARADLQVHALEDLAVLLHFAGYGAAYIRVMEKSLQGFTEMMAYLIDKNGEMFESDPILLGMLEASTAALKEKNRIQLLLRGEEVPTGAEPDWSKAPPKAAAWAVDANGEAFWYPGKPEIIEDREWATESGRAWWDRDIPLEELGDWRQSLRMRPVEEDATPLDLDEGMDLASALSFSGFTVIAFDENGPRVLNIAQLRSELAAEEGEEEEGYWDVGPEPDWTRAEKYPNAVAWAYDGDGEAYWYDFILPTCPEDAADLAPWEGVWRALSSCSSDGIVEEQYRADWYKSLRLNPKLSAEQVEALRGGLML